MHDSSVINRKVTDDGIHASDYGATIYGRGIAAETDEPSTL